MIEFPCHCGHKFSLGEDSAGGMIQCPKCGRLNDIPTLSDVGQIEDGIFQISKPETQKTDSQLISDMRLLHSRERVDDNTGAEIDLRLTQEDVENTGVDAVPLEMADQVRPGRPKYDPVTGELVRPIDVVPGEKRIDAATVPFAKKTLNYSTEAVKTVGVGKIFLALFHPINLLVMSFVVLLQAFFEITLMVWSAGVFIIAPGLLVAIGLVAAYYGNVVDEIGPTGRDELPRPFRDLDWGDDLWGPASKLVFSLLICFWPVLLPLRYFSDTTHVSWIGLLLLLGLVLFPAVFLTSICSGSVLNLRPDRLISVIRACGSQYVVSIFAFMIGGGIYLGAMAGVHLSFIALFITKTYGPPILGMSIGSAVLIVGIFLMHFACWHLGYLYRIFYPNFHWVLQRHVRTRDPVTRTKPRYPQNRQPRTKETEDRLAELRENEKKLQADSQKYLDQVLPPDSGRGSQGGGYF